MGDTVRIGYYSFSATELLTLGTPKRFRTRERPMCRIETKTFVVNVPCAGFLILHGIFVNGEIPNFK